LRAGFQQDIDLPNKKGGSEKPPRMVQKINTALFTPIPKSTGALIKEQKWIVNTFSINAKK
jgi:hypothetical protein